MAQSVLKTGARTYSSAIETADNYTRWVLSRFSPYFGARILEVGLGHGGYRRFVPPSARYIGLDLDDACVARARSRHPQDRFVIADVTQPKLVADLAGEAIDTVLCINVLEHIADDRLAVANLLRLLSPGGHLLVMVPAFARLYSQLDQMAGHLRRYTRVDAQRLTEPLGQVRRCEYFNAVGGAGWYVNKLFRHADLDAASVNAQIRFFDRFVVPAARVVDGLTRRSFGQSLILVIQRP